MKPKRILGVLVSLPLCSLLSACSSRGGSVSTVAGAATLIGGFADGTGATAAFNNPRGIAVDESRNVYVTDTYNHAIRRITSAP
jgi:hypothetical protein